MESMKDYFGSFGGFQFYQYVCMKLGKVASCLYIEPANSMEILRFAKVKNWEVLDSLTHYNSETKKEIRYKINENCYCYLNTNFNEPYDHKASFYFHCDYELKLRNSLPLSDFKLNVTKSNIYILTSKNQTQCFVPFQIRLPQINFKLHYNDDFEEFNLNTVQLTRSNANGIIMMHGKPGTGKTTYLKYLTSQSQRNFLYVTPDMTNWLGSSNFNTILQDFKNSVLIIEDAEVTLGKKSEIRNNATSNILNITDGILGDCFNILVICTFNTHLNNIDEALFRPGRLKAYYEFKALGAEKVKEMSHGRLQHSMTLAEIHNDQSKIKISSKRIGFGVR